MRRWLVGRLPEKILYRLVLARRLGSGWQAYARRGRRRLRGTAGDGAPGYRPLDTFPTWVTARIVTTFDALGAARDNLHLVSEAFELAGVPHVVIPSQDRAEARIAVSEVHRRAALGAIAGLATPEWCIASTTPADATTWSRRHVSPAGHATGRRWQGRSGIRVFRLQCAPNGDCVGGPELGCHVDLWQPVTASGIPRPDGGDFEVGSHLAPSPSNQIVSYLSPASWTAATGSATHSPPGSSHPSLFEVRQPIDIVYTWVDGSDPEWRERKGAFDDKVLLGEVNESAVHASRFQSRDELKYSLRSVAMFAGWVRTIYIVTDQQVPAWLDTSHPKIRIVDHRDIFTDPSALPVFNSHAIESQLHHIEGLSEQYLYLNDDVFFGRPVRPELFFHGNGLSKFFLSKATLDLDPPSPRDLPVMSAAKRNRALIEQRLGATVTRKFKHTPHPQLRSVLEQMEQEYPEMFAAVERSRFRHPDDYSITSALHHYYGYGIGKAMPGTIRYDYQDIARSDTPRRLSNLLQTRDYDAFCLNDHETDPVRHAPQQLALADFLERYFPVPSPFELCPPAGRR